ncbi:hypothetical protein [Paenibacillus segetis]|uniref:Uncharacterized protein n=1 Tax=Paenibacillus segetis TaxID=1325360 RepID=A0ABQ1YA95_9BACL|nr:hypothetical protein [Paenibacillus segetis]GGH17222.1 hypothetical protein GCM10008013_12420 [Paenibacillus segetis]
MIIELVGALVSGIVGVVGVVIGGTLTYKLSHRSEMILIRKKIKIDKIQETQRGLFIMVRQLGILHLRLKEIENKRISREEFLNTSNQVQEECGTVIRNIRTNEVFLKEYIDLIDDFINQTSVFHDLIYDAYIYPNSPSKRNYDSDLLSYEHIEYLIMEAIKTVMKIKDHLDQQIEIELK